MMWLGNMQEFDIYMIIVILLLWHVVVKMMITISDVIIIACTNDGYIRLLVYTIILPQRAAWFIIIFPDMHDSVRVWLCESVTL